MIGIYKIINPKNKIYIGQSINIIDRFRKYKNLYLSKGQKKLYNSLLKYGPGNHKFEILEICLKEELYQKEIYWISFYNCIKEGLNIRKGGEGKKQNNIKYKHSEEFLKKLNKRLKGNKYLLNHKMTQESKIKMSEAKNYLKKKVFCIELNKNYNSITEAARDLNLNIMVVSNSLRGYVKKNRNNLTFKYG